MSCAVLRVQVVDGDAIEPQVIDQYVAIVSGKRWCNVCEERPGVLDRRRDPCIESWRPPCESSSGEHAEGCGAATAVVSDKDGFPGVVDGNIARSAPVGSNSIDEAQLVPGNRKRGDGTAFFSVEVVHLVDSVEMAAIGRKRQEAGIDSRCRQPEWRHDSRVSIPTKPVDAPAGVPLSV